MNKNSFTKEDKRLSEQFQGEECECGGWKTRTPHSSWCPCHPEKVTERLLDIIFNGRWRKNE